MNIRKIMVCVLAVLSAVSLLTACGTSESRLEKNRRENAEKSEAEAALAEAELPEEVEADRTEDILADVAADTTESRLDDDFYIEKLVSEAGVNRDSILAVCTDDYEGKGEYASFIFAGENDVEMGTFYGSIWYVSENGAEKIREDMEYYSVNNVLKFPNTDKCFYYADEYYATQAVSRVYGVKDGSSYESVISGLGGIAPGENGDFTITVSAYDCTYYSEDDLTLGHSWKPYYFYYDEKKDSFAEYCGKEISMNEVARKCGVDIGAEIKSLNGEVLEAYDRDNGIVTVNYEIRQDYDDGNYSIEYNQANFDTNSGQYIDAWGSGEHNLTASGYGGTYLVGICPEFLED